ncbi:putative bifunctional diguanylate cyclase/phosphodiesterase [Nitratireductor luteus]|uniref:putative bifunctional diguanylate cyclase/phosphodiesterase n=1 Tax=Nitratireductor luteus TaxID=2976980 RepID=UPI0022403203|nr:bifunctional diguanylate cyclase/phosphodiesterase [Nitratireductor luteus]
MPTQHKKTIAHFGASILGIPKAASWTWRIAAAALVGVLSIGAAAVVYVTGGTSFAYSHVAYVAIIAGAAAFGLPGGVVTAVVTSLFLGPLMPLDVAAGIAQATTNWLVRGAFFVLIGGLAGLAFSIRDRQLHMIRRQSYYNPLTGLANRTRCLERLDQLIRSGIPQHSPLLLLSLQIGQLETISSSLGHEQGASLQKAVAERLKRVLPDDAKLFHISSGVFALVVTAPQEEAAAVGSALVEALNEPVIIDGIPIRSEAHVGLAQFGEHASTSLALLRASLSALQDATAAKQAVLVFDHRRDDARRARLRLLPDLQRALRNSEEITLHYQPKVALETGVCVGAEALVRWHHPEFGLIAPSDFIPIAEQTELIRPLSERVLSLAIRQMADWHTQGLPLSLSVNLAIRNLEEANLPAMILELLERHGVEARRLEVEVTESGLIRSLDEVSTNLALLQDLGISVALDDFGTGQSSIAYLRDLPADSLKLDRTFLRDDAMANPRSRLLIETTLEACHKLGFSVTAEGIETKAVYDLLRDLSCDFGQGFFIAKPLTEAEFRAWLIRECRRGLCTRK